MLRMIASRLDRMESKMDSLAEAIGAFARLEERQSGHFDAIRRVHEHQDRLEERVEKLEKFKWRSAGIATGVAATVGLAAGVLPYLTGVFG